MKSIDGLPIFDKEKISEEILARCEKDQAMRKQWAESNFNPELYDEKLDLENQEYLREIIKKLNGWPRISEFGVDVADALWVMVQHAPDLEIKKSILLEMQQLSASEINPKNIARTVDRIRILEGKGQLYGTSWTSNNKTKVLSCDPIEDEEHIDQRRAALGLDTFAEQKERAHKSYQEHFEKT